MIRSVLVAPLLAGAIILALSGCATQADAAHRAAASGAIAVVASTSVYGDIAQQIGGSNVEVTSLIDSADRDPHEYQADARNQLELSKAGIVIENGGGYDDFVDTMLSAAGPDPTLLNVAGISGKPDAAGGFNEHLWYDFPTMGKLATHLVAVLSDKDPTHAESYRANGAAFQADLATLETTEAKLKLKYAGTGVAITEPLPLYLLDAIGLENKTPPEFSAAVEDDNDVAADVLQHTLTMFHTGVVKLLVYDAQTAGPQTEAVLSAAKEGNVPAVPVTETLPTGTHYISWMTTNLEAITHALGTTS